MKTTRPFQVLQGGLSPDEDDPFGPRPDLHVVGAKRRRNDLPFIRERTHVAMIPHYCDTCAMTIDPGDVYKRTFIVSPENKYRVRVNKEHLYPECPGPPIDELREEDVDFGWHEEPAEEKTQNVA